MTTMKLSEQHADNVADQAAISADHAIKTTQRATNNAFDRLAGGVQDLRQQASPLIDRATSQANAMAQRGVDAARDTAQRGVDAARETAQQLRERALRASDNTVTYIRDEPVKSMLIAAAVGAGLMAVLGMLRRDRGSY